jgi:uncharacterized protein YbjT (DUF2867 family)
MKIIVIGGTGLIGTKVVTKLLDGGHDAIPASPNSGVNTITGEGLAEVLTGADVVVDVSNSPSFEDAAVFNFFETSARNILYAATEARVGHVVALSVVGTQSHPEIAYFRAKIAQENLIMASGIPYSLVHATQFFEFVGGIADSATTGDQVSIPPVLIQPMAADDVATVVARVAAHAPLNGIHEIAGPEQFRFDEFVRQGLLARNDPRNVVADVHAHYFGAEIAERTLVPEGDAELSGTTFEQWLALSAMARQ